MDKSTNTIIIEYPPEVLWALQKDQAEFEIEARLILALKLYESGKLSSGLAAKIAGIPRVAFLFLFGQHGHTPFGETTEDIEEDLKNIRGARHRQ